MNPLLSMTRRTWFARLLGALAAAPLVGKAVTAPVDIVCPSQEAYEAAIAAQIEVTGPLIEAEMQRHATLWKSLRIEENRAMLRCLMLGDD